MAEHSPQNQRPWNVLLVEDEPTVLQVLKGMLEHDGLSVTAATTGDEALGRLRESAFDLLVTDKNLPGPDGVELARWARDHDPRIGIVMMTGYASWDSAQAVLGVVDEYFTKPFDLRAFRRALLNVLERRAQLAQPPEPREASPARPTVLLVHNDDRQRERLARLLGSLDVDVRPGTMADLETHPDALVIDTAACGADEARAVWRYRAGYRNFPVVALSRAAHLDGSLRAISIMARAHLLSSEEDELLLGSLRQALAPEPPRAVIAAAAN